MIDTTQTDPQVKVISFRSRCYSTLPRMLWQELFNYYRQHGGDLDNMDNMLIDHASCKHAIDMARINYNEKFLWGFSSGCHQTDWVAGHQFDKQGVPFVVSTFSHDFFVLCELTLQEAKFTIIKSTED